MPIDYGTDGGNYERLPKIGEEPKIFEIATCNRIDDATHKFNFKKNEKKILADGNEAIVEVNCGFRYVYTLKNGKQFNLNSWKPFFAFRDANVQDGDKIKVSHPAKGEWKVELVRHGETQPDIGWDA